MACITIFITHFCAAQFPEIGKLGTYDYCKKVDTATEALEAIQLMKTKAGKCQYFVNATIEKFPGK